ncbi:MAG TPA: PilZ domain-containing protein [Sphingomonas sp.]|nr:PilZ domain-containing protein [Sphingomonas sp.]
MTSMIEAARDRASERRNFFLSTNLAGLSEGTLNARVRNLSAGGMMVELAAEPEPEIVRGQRLTAELRNIGRIKGEIAWCEGRRFGIRFDREINPEAARKPLVAGEGTPDYVKPILVPGRSLRYVESLKGR